MILLAGGTFRQSQHWADKWGLKPTEWQHLSHPKQLYGLRRNGDIWLAGQYWLNPVLSNFSFKEVGSVFGVRILTPTQEEKP